MKILMICLGNICRSPLAEGILKQKVKEKGLNWQVDSAGTSAYHVGEQPDERSIAVAKEHGLDITDQRSRPLTLQDLEEYDLLLVMDSSNYNNVKKLCRNQNQVDKIELIMNYPYPNRNTPVPDPYWGENGFENVYQMLEKACTVLIEKISVMQ
jgi:protein-tyrosine phosphatase